VGRRRLARNRRNGCERLTAEPTLAANQPGLLLLSELRFLEFVGPRIPDELQVDVTYETDAAPARTSLRLPVLAYQSKGTYAYPLKQDRLLAVNLPLNLTQHREMHSQEFAFDVVSVALEGSALRTAKAKKPSQLSDDCVYRRDVLAIGDGIVVAAADGFPESEMADPTRYSEAFFKELMGRLLPKLGFKAALAGNHLVVDHGNGEFSFYAHLSEVGKKVGDKVAKGEVIGKVGNTGNSTEPHLHFQLMDGPGFLAPNSLPVTFTDVPPGNMSANTTAANMVVSSDFLLLTE